MRRTRPSRRQVLGAVNGLCAGITFHPFRAQLLSIRLSLYCLWRATCISFNWRLQFLFFQHLCRPLVRFAKYLLDCVQGPNKAVMQAVGAFAAVSLALGGEQQLFIALVSKSMTSTS